MTYKIYTRTIVHVTICMFMHILCVAQSINVAPMDCYPNFMSAQEMDDAAALSDGFTPFATWKGAYDYAILNGITEINFAPGTYYPGGFSGTSDRWGDASGGYELYNGITVNGNGAVIDNSANNNSIAFATIAGNGVIISGFTFIQYTGNNGGAIVVNAVSGWEINNCNFDGCDWAGDGLVINGGTGTINNCSLYNHTRSTGSAMTITGGNVTLNNTSFLCNSRIVAGGAVRNLNGAVVTYNNCTFSGNLTNSASGGAISIESSSNVTMDGTVFTCNTADVNTQDDGGAINLIGSASLYLDGCTFDGNIAKDRGGAIHASGAAVLDIASTTFTNNSTNTGSTSKGGAIFMNDISSNNIDGSLFSGNSVTGEGGGIFVAAGSGGMYNFDDCTFISNSASGQCTGIDVFTERHITGSNNDLQFKADGWHATNPTNSGSLQYSNLILPAQQLNAGGTQTYQSSSVVLTGSPIYWSFTMYATGLNTDARLAYVLSADNSDLTTGNGLAVIFRRYTSTNCDLELVSYSGGVGGTLTLISTLVNTAAVSGSFAVNAVYTAGTFQFFIQSAGTSAALDYDPRGFNYCSSPVTASASLYNGFVGFYWRHNSTSSSTFGRFGNNYFRTGDETTGGGGGGSGQTASCQTCPLSSSTPSANCTNQGSIAGTVFDDTASPDGSSTGNTPISGVLVRLFAADGTLLASTYTDANGNYLFSGLSDGSYYVNFAVPAGYLGATYQNTGNPDIDSDIDLVSLATHTVTINTNASSGNNATSSNGMDEESGYAHYQNLDAGFTTAVLPVVWGDVYATQENCQVNVHWTTLEESKNHYFVIEKSYDGYAFEDVGIIYANESLRTDERMYSYMYDETLTEGQIFFRIKQVDYNGMFSHSHTIKYNLGCLKSQKFSIVPNPAHQDYVRLVAEGIDFSSAQWYILDGQGRVISSVYPVGNRIDISELPAGLYFIQNQNNGEIVTEKFIKF